MQDRRFSGGGNYRIPKRPAVRLTATAPTFSELSALDKVAELMAEGMDSDRIANKLGYGSRASVNGQIQRIRKQLGWQAC